MAGYIKKANCLFKFWWKYFGQWKWQCMVFVSPRW